MMIIQPKYRGFICTTAHPVGCAQNVQQQIAYCQDQPKISGLKKVLVIGSSSGYGLASRIVAAFAAQAQTIGVFNERPASSNRTASAGWYNTAAFEQAAIQAGLYTKSINGDAFSPAVKEETITAIKADLGCVDLVIYSLAAPKRIDPQSQITYTSTLKPIGKKFTSKSVDFHTGEVSEVTLEPAAPAEVEGTVKVMGGEDWLLWHQALQAANVLAPECTSIAYSYIGPKVTHAVYRDGTIGKAKEHLESCIGASEQLIEPLGGKSYLVVNKAVVTQSSAAIPVVPLYLAVLAKVMREKGVHEGCVEQIYRLFATQLYGDIETDKRGRIRIDDLEMRADVQEEVLARWAQITSDNIHELSDLNDFRREFFMLFGFGIPGVDYEQDVDPIVAIPSIH